MKKYIINDLMFKKDKTVSDTIKKTQQNIILRVIKLIIVRCISILYTLLRGEQCVNRQK